MNTHQKLRLWQVLLLALLTLPGRPCAAGVADATLHVGFSSAMFAEVNENYAKASVKAWGQSVAKERGIPTDPETCILQGTPALLAALRNKSVDVVAVTMIEYAVLSREIHFAPIFVTTAGGQTREQYLVLVNRDNGIERLSDLRGRSLAFHQNARDCLAQPWLDTQLITETGKSTADWLGKITQSPKLARVILPVFFHQCDACVVDRTGFETMCELNPQVGKQLKIIAQSPEVVPAVFCFRADYAPAFKEQLFQGIRDLNKTATGQQLLTIFQSEKIEDEPASCLDSALALLARHAKLTGAAVVANGPNPSAPPQLSKGVMP
jgi:ABC-type phosphate/phosphonate transport system substrate-binding protein